MKSLLATLAVAATLATPAIAAEDNVWSTSFDSGYFETTGPFPWASLGTTFGGASLQSATGFTGFGTQMYRNDTDGTTNLTASGLGGHTALRVKFDIAFIDSWDGNPQDFCCGPDILFVDIDGTGYQWSANNAQGTAVYGPGTIISTGTDLGYGTWTDTIVRYEFLIPHVASTFSMSINFGGAGFQGGLDESWAIDNFALSAIYDRSLVPEPATWAMLITGFGLVGATMRKRRAAIA